MPFGNAPVVSIDPPSLISTETNERVFHKVLMLELSFLIPVLARQQKIDLKFKFRLMPLFLHKLQINAKKKCSMQTI